MSEDPSNLIYREGLPPEPVTAENPLVGLEVSGISGRDGNNHKELNDSDER